MSEELLNLAALADLNVEEVEEYRYEVPAQGIYDVEIVESSISDATSNDGDPMVKGEAQFKIINVQSLIDRAPQGVDKDEYAASMVGKTVNHSNVIRTTDGQREQLESIGRMRAFANDIGAEWGPNIIDNWANFKGLRIEGVRLTHGRSKTDPDARFPRLKFPARR